MVKGQIAAKKYKKSYRRLRAAKKKPYSRNRTKRFRRIAKKSLRHTAILTVGEHIQVNYGVMEGLLQKSNKYFNMEIQATGQIPLGAADAQSIGTALTNAISDKHIELIRSLTDDKGYITQAPHINYHGIKIRAVGDTGYETGKKAVFPMLYYQNNETHPLTPIVFVNGKIYLKFPKQVREAGEISRLWPLHLCVFNCKTIKVKIYYTVQGKPGFNAFKDNKGKGVFQLQTPEYGANIQTDWTKTDWRAIYKKNPDAAKEPWQ